MSFNQRSCVRGDNSQCQVRNAIYLKTSHTKYTQKQPTLEAYIFLLHHFEAPHPPRCSCATLIVSNHTNRSFLASGVNPPTQIQTWLLYYLQGLLHYISCKGDITLMFARRFLHRLVDASKTR
jgi:hypothetical protein